MLLEFFFWEETFTYKLTTPKTIYARTPVDSQLKIVQVNHLKHTNKHLH